MVKRKEESGITLIALIITIIVLLILAGVSISLVVGENGIIGRTVDSRAKTNEADAKERVWLEVDGSYDETGKINIDDLNKNLRENLSGVKLKVQSNDSSEEDGDFMQLSNTNKIKRLPATVQYKGYDITIEGNGEVTIKGGPTSGGTTPTTPEELKVGSTVEYNPSGTYTWQAKYCSSKKETVDQALNSASGNDFNISEWRVLSIEGETVELVPSKVITGTVYLGQPQGYNNAVKLLNDACGELYGNTEKGITARSINIEDIEKYMTEEAKTSAHEEYNTRPPNEYDKNVSYYPAIYAQEDKAVINGQEISGGIGRSSQDEFVESDATIQEPIGEGQTMAKTATDGKIQAEKSIMPYTTYWYGDKDFMKNAFKKYNNSNSYYELIIPEGERTSYYIASRSTFASHSGFSFDIFCVSSGWVSGAGMYYSYYGPPTDYYSAALFPVVSLSSELIKSGDDSFKVVV